MLSSNLLLRNTRQAVNKLAVCVMKHGLSVSFAAMGLLQ